MTKAISLAIGTTYNCTPTFFDQKGAPILPAPATPTYTSDTPSVATVDAAGKITAVAAGLATVTATSGELSATVAVVVPAPPEPYTPTPSALAL